METLREQILKLLQAYEGRSASSDHEKLQHELVSKLVALLYQRKDVMQS